MRNLLAAMLASAALAPAAVQGVEPTYREIQVSLDVSCVVPPNEWSADMNATPGFAWRLGVTAVPRLTSGVYFTYARFGAKRDFVPRWLDARVGDRDWSRYSGGLFAEYLFTGGRVAPFIGAAIGIHGVFIEYAEHTRGPTGAGQFDLGFGASSGLHYRHGRRLGGTFRLLVEDSPGMDSGWFLHTQLGVSVFL